MKFISWNVNGLRACMGKGFLEAFRSLDADESLVAGVPYRAMHVECIDDHGDPYDRLFYWDICKPEPGYTDGTKLVITYHDREIADIQTA